MYKNTTFVLIFHCALVLPIVVYYFLLLYSVFTYSTPSKLLCNYFPRSILFFCSRSTLLLGHLGYYILRHLKKSYNSSDMTFF